ncbi:lysoplasmalogenase family protein [Qipengyuania oceanensis]|uniref:Lysoplasmalogenase n=1 Tax=Qipengyuania oceanensis TaxID=1463597 RepID=A0A844YBZ5_9SPHN|nr:lysoplasmalogenase family protein [Qipengyuania oceanensis]MXO61731.1 lysoplasmalogenase [Qipengyuania oceanensis]
MPKRALVDHRPWLLLSIVSAVAYYFLTDNQLGGTWLILLKGGACMALAVYAWQRHDSANAKLIALYLLLCSLADMALELWFEIGGALFFAAHLAAISLYLRNRRIHLAPSQRILAALLLVATPLVCWLLSSSPAVGLYGLALGGMAAGAWISRFPRYRVGAGAVLFVISDFLIFARMGGNLVGVADLLVWPIYFSAQFLIATGVIRTLRGELKASTD